MRRQRHVELREAARDMRFDLANIISLICELPYQLGWHTATL